jgi:hypothetical protein
MNDNLKKVKKDREYINCNQEYEIETLVKNGYSIEAINHCCDQDIDNNPRDRFIKCLEDYDK